MYGRLTRQLSGLGSTDGAPKRSGVLLGGMLALAVCSYAGCSLETGGTSADTGSVEPDEPDEPVDPDKDNDDPDDEQPGTSGGNNTNVDAGTPRSDASTSGGNNTVGPCKAGRYEGMYECMSKASGGLLGGPATVSVSGPVSFTLVESSNDDDTFDFVDGEFKPSSSAFQTASAEINATLECGKPFQGALVKGQVSSLFNLSGSTFGSALRAGYDGKSSAFTGGTWEIRADTTNAGCMGTWSARYVGE